MQVLQDYRGGEPVMQYFCLTCVTDPATWPAPGSLERPRLRLSSLLALVGCFLGLLAVLADFLIPPHLTAGFGWHKEASLAVGAVLMLVGALARADLLAWGGAFVLGIALVAGLFGVTAKEGFGWKQGALLDVALACVGLAALIRLAPLRAIVRSGRAGLSHRHAAGVSGIYNRA